MRLLRVSVQSTQPRGLDPGTETSALMNLEDPEPAFIGPAADGGTREEAFPSLGLWVRRSHGGA